MKGFSIAFFGERDLERKTKSPNLSHEREREERDLRDSG